MEHNLTTKIILYEHFLINSKQCMDLFHKHGNINVLNKALMGIRYLLNLTILLLLYTRRYFKIILHTCVLYHNIIVL